jgi:predicted hotdog family 3-hydroxylacyl-ACP dehydratase
VTDSGAYPSIEELLPHRGPMLLIDRVTAADAERLSAQASVNAQAWYADAGGNMPAWIGVELMAQAIAAFVGLEQRRQGKPIKIGFLLGTRKYSCAVPAFARDAVLDVTAHLVYREASGLGAFDCHIELKGERVADATIKVFEPDDPARFMTDEPS